MKITVNILDEAIVLALQEIGSKLVANAESGDLGSFGAKTCYEITRDGKPITPDEIKKERGKEHLPAEYKLIFRIEV